MPEQTAPVYACLHGHQQPDPGACVTCGEPVDRVRTSLDVGLGALDALRTEVDKDPRSRALAAALAKAEERAIVEALVVTGGNRSEAARVVDMPLRTFMRKVPLHAPPAPKAVSEEDLVDLVGKVGQAEAAAQLGLAPRSVENRLRTAAKAAGVKTTTKRGRR